MKSTKESRYQDRLRSYATPLVQERFSKQMKHAPTGLLMFDEQPGSSKAHFCSEGPAIIERMTEEQMKKHDNMVRAQAKELEGRGQMHGIVLELITGLLKSIREAK